MTRKGLYVVLTNCTDAAREAEFNEWYNNMAVPDILASPGFVAATRYRLVGQRGEGQAKYLTLYEVEVENLEAFSAEHMRTLDERAAQRRAKGRIFDAIEPFYLAWYEPITPRITEEAPGA